MLLEDADFFYLNSKSPDGRFTLLCKAIKYRSVTHVHSPAQTAS